MTCTVGRSLSHEFSELSSLALSETESCPESDCSSTMTAAISSYALNIFYYHTTHE